MSQAELAQKAGIHLQSVGKVESGKTAKLNSKSRFGLSKALQSSEEYLDAVCKGVPVETVQQLKICLHCWILADEAETTWLHPRAKYCFACGEKLHDRCLHCNEPIMSLKFRFCPYCGTTTSQQN